VGTMISGIIVGGVVFGVFTLLNNIRRGI